MLQQQLGTCQSCPVHVAATGTHTVAATLTQQRQTSCPSRSNASLLPITPPPQQHPANSPTLAPATPMINNTRTHFGPAATETELSRETSNAQTAGMPATDLPVQPGHCATAHIHCSTVIVRVKMNHLGPMQSFSQAVMKLLASINHHFGGHDGHCISLRIYARGIPQHAPLNGNSSRL
jgi:hypothetical protein